MTENTNSEHNVAINLPPMGKIDFQKWKQNVRTVEPIRDTVRQPTLENKEVDRQNIKEEMVQFSKNMEEKMAKFMALVSSQQQTINIGETGTKRPNDTNPNDNSKRYKPGSTATISKAPMMDTAISNFPENKATISKAPKRGTAISNCPGNKATISNRSKKSTNDEDTSEVEMREDEMMSIHASDDEFLEGQVKTLTQEEEESLLGESEEEDGDALLNALAGELTNREKTSDPLGEKLAVVIDNIWKTPISKDTLAKKLDAYQRPSNVEKLIVKRCNPEIWSERLSTHVRSKDLKTQKVQSGITKGTIALSQVLEDLIKIKNNKELNARDIRKNLNSTISKCTDGLALLAHTNQSLEQQRRDQIVSSLDKPFIQLAKDVPEDSIELFGDDLPKRLTTIKANQKILAPEYTRHSSKNAYRPPQYPRGREQGGSFQKPYYKKFQPKPNNTKKSQKQYKKTKYN